MKNDPWVKTAAVFTGRKNEGTSCLNQEKFKSLRVVIIWTSPNSPHLPRLKENRGSKPTAVSSPVPPAAQAGWEETWVMLKEAERGNLVCD